MENKIDLAKIASVIFDVFGFILAIIYGVTIYENAAEITQVKILMLMWMSWYLALRLDKCEFKI